MNKPGAVVPKGEYGSGACASVARVDTGFLVISELHVSRPVRAHVSHCCHFHPYTCIPALASCR
jgi:hypothetical protein